MIRKLFKSLAGALAFAALSVASVSSAQVAFPTPSGGVDPATQATITANTAAATANTAAISALQPTVAGLASPTVNTGYILPVVGTPGGSGQYFPADQAAFDTTAVQWGFTPDTYLFSELMETNSCNGRLNALFARGIRVTQIMSPSSSYTMAQIRDGALDAAIIAKAKCYANHRVIVRAFHEFNGNYSANYNTYVTTPAVWIAAWQHVYTLLHTYAPDITIVWNPDDFGPGRAADTDPSTYWPGDAYVDLIGVDLYDVSYSNYSFQDKLAGVMPTLTGTFGGLSAGTKPILVTEMGVDNTLSNPGASSTNASAATQAAWWLDMWAYMNTMPYGSRLIGVNPWSRSPYSITDATAIANFKAGAATYRALHIAQ